ncbi:MAG: hypothetical protein ACR2OF_00025 [Hyphomicrobium sp.]
MTATLVVTAFGVLIVGYLIFAWAMACLRARMMQQWDEADHDPIAISEPALIIDDLSEPILADDYRVWCGNAYVADGRVIQSPGSGTVAELKDLLGVSEIRRCDISGRGLHARYDFKVEASDDT